MARIQSNFAMNPVLVGLFIILVLLVLVMLAQKRRIFRFARKQKGPTFYPVLGNAHWLIGEDVFSGIQKLVDKFSLPCNLWIGHDYTYLTDVPSEVNAVLNSLNTFEKASIYKTMEPGFEGTMLLSKYEVWKPRRKFFSRSFNTSLLKSFVPTFCKKSNILINVLKDVNEDENVFVVFEKLSLDSFCESVIGIDLDLQVTHHNYIGWTTEIQDILSRRILDSYIPFFIWKHTKLGRRMTELLNLVNEFIKTVLKVKRDQRAKSEEFIDSNMLPVLDSMLFAEGSHFSDHDIFKELFLFTAAEKSIPAFEKISMINKDSKHNETTTSRTNIPPDIATDTTGFTLAYTFTLLGMNPAIQQKVYEEVMDVVGHNEITNEHLNELKYTERAIQESMRLLPVIPFMGRHANKDIDLGSKVLPKGSNILICLFHMQRNEKYWKNPLEYDPDRFLPENFAKIEPGAYVPFSLGLRNCIGKTYAVMFMKVVVADVLRNYRVTSKYKSVEELDLTSCVSMKTRHHLDCHFIAREHTKNNSNNY